MRRFWTIGLVATVALAGRAHAQEFSADYTVSLYGFTLARSSFTSRIDGDRYEIRGTIGSSGLAAVFDDTDGRVVIDGQFKDDRAVPDSYMLDYKSGKKKKRTTVRLEDGDVVATENVPPPKPRRHGWVPVEANHLTGVVDPLSATIVKADSLDDVCGRTVSVYDGEMRADLALTYQGRAPVVSPGYKGDAVTCSVRFTPIAGYRKGNRTIEYLAAGHDMRVTFVPMGETGYFVPLKGQVQTKIGTVHFQVSRNGSPS